MDKGTIASGFFAQLATSTTAQGAAHFKSFIPQALPRQYYNLRLRFRVAQVADFDSRHLDGNSYLFLIRSQI
jgi:hypothetical protein